MNGTIGIVGGVGPLAGVDLHKKIISNTHATLDQEHISVIHASFPSLIQDRTRYVIQGDVENPAIVLLDIIKQLCHLGASVIGVPCNSAHVAPIFSILERESISLNIKLVHMLEEVCDVLRKEVNKQNISVGLLATMGVYTCNVYADVLNRNGINVLYPDSIDKKRKVHDAIYHPEYGIKACADISKISHYPQETFISISKELISNGADAIIMGCTEIPLIADKLENSIDAPLIDPTNILARALIRYSNPQKLINI